DIGASQRGTLMGPAALRTAGLLTLLDGLGFEVRDHGDLSIGDVADLADAPPDNAKHYREIQRWTRALSARAYELAQSAIPIFLGGDHTLSMGSVNGIARHWHAAGREVFVVWLDAHADYNTPATACCTPVSALIFSIPAWRPASAPRCPVARPIEKRIW